ncbi:helix-turn-helix transcriptional regulator [Microlunatus sp. Gsoil 973]|jgi:DNA-binding transcriptional ArsR family regulator|uniref:ArsR/SmtB family transcription factor n=1 Tax=Microlunatus sp. Gsoil 973 TaxID=2672569 RepID=UPI0012B45344|nr:metalloregulator ArsR/SmtB family transcription factor [Microlunatus sp. Gsoil 973]QGN33865.1 metalloregulator ArsR/SmtB family transcription factor [Microlunatus sp. Gsoil 973]
MTVTDDPDTLSRTFSALADPTRRSILARLTQGEATVNELAAPHSLSLPAISKHLKVLQTAGLVTKRREAQTRPCALNPAPLQDAEAWLQQYRRFFEESFDRLEEHLRHLQADPSDAGDAKP